MTEQLANENLDASARRNFVVYGSTTAFLTLGVWTDFLSRGRNLFTLMAGMMATKLVFVSLMICYNLKTGEQLIERYAKTIMFLYGYSSCLVTTLELQLIPLYIAGRYRDLNSAWELPLAGQMLALAQLAVLWFPNIFASVICQFMSGIDNAIVVKLPIILLLAFAFVPMRTILKFEAAQRRVITRQTTVKSDL